MRIFISHISICQTGERTLSLRTTIHISRSTEEVFSFFSDARNLEKLTPNTLRFRILTRHPILMQVGTLIDYSIRLYGVTLRWRSEITAWEPPFRFVDKQLKDPYKTWIHEHKFQSLNGYTLVSDKGGLFPPSRRAHEQMGRA